MKYIFIFIIKLYRRYVSALKRQPCCRFSPTCSQYALTAYEKHGFFKGTYLSVMRILRCNPFCKGGIDPVPERITYKGIKQRNNRENGEL